MALIRIKSTGRLADHAPGELGLALGLDRAPEMKTVRRKLAELGVRGLALEFSRAFSERWAEEEPTALGYLYINGHVRPYHGSKHKLPKTHVQRRRLCMPATTDYWVNGANAEPLMFVTAPANEGLLAMMETELLPEIRKLAGDDRSMTLIFDRQRVEPETVQEVALGQLRCDHAPQGQVPGLAATLLQGGVGQGLWAGGDVSTGRATGRRGQGLPHARGTATV